MERGIPERYLHRHAARSSPASCRRHSHRGRQLSRSRKRAGNRCPAQKEMTPIAGPAYVAAVLTLYVDLPDTPLRANAQDQWLARKLQEHAVPLPLIESAFLLASLRRLLRPADLPPRPPIRSLAYFQPVLT